VKRLQWLLQLHEYQGEMGIPFFISCFIPIPLIPEIPFPKYPFAWKAPQIRKVCDGF